MRHRNPALLFLLPFTSIDFTVFLVYSEKSVTSQRRDKRVNSNRATGQNQNPNDPSSTSTPLPSTEVVKVDVDLVTTDALVLQKKTARIVGGLKKEDFAIYEDGAKQEVTHFSQDSLPLSVLLRQEIAVSRV
jgi:hypothetical protein